MPRKRRIDIPGTLHHVIVRGIEQKALFLDDGDRIEFLNRLEKGLKKTKCHCFAWALLSNHFHLLIRIGEEGLSALMRSLLTGYAIYFNHKYKRSGYLYQNRYKSILCQEEPYLLELVRYIHLNPLRAGLVKDLKELSRFHWCGHSVVLGNRNNSWQSVDEVLIHFGDKKSNSIRKYEKFVSEGIGQGRREDLIGGGLIRSVGGWSRVNALKKLGLKWRSDDRILGEGDFVEKVLKAIDDKLQRQEQLRQSGMTMEKALARVRQVTGIPEEKILSRQRKREYVEARVLFSYWANNDLGVSNKGIGRFTQAVINLVAKGEEMVKKGNDTLQLTSVP